MTSARGERHCGAKHYDPNKKADMSRIGKPERELTTIEKKSRNKCPMFTHAPFGTSLESVPQD